MKTNGNCRKILVTVAGNALMYRGPPLKVNKQTLCSLHLLDTKNEGRQKGRTAHRTNCKALKCYDT